MKTEISTYEQQANDFLTKTNTTFTAEFLKHGKHFTDDKDTRDIYKITLKRGQRSYTFNFGQSIKNSGEYQMAEHLRNKLIYEELQKKHGSKYAFRGNSFLLDIKYRTAQSDFYKNENFAALNAYDILTCLTTYDPGTLEDFCSEFGYDTGSKKAEKTYNAVLDEWRNLQALFSDAELTELQEIQ